MTDPGRAGRQNFQVDLHGVVDLLARHLYSSPRVYLRELLQNAVDAITARSALEVGAPASVRITPGPGGTLEVRDTGIGLTLEEATELLATIGRSSKRDIELGEARAEYLGQFGIGLLSAFLVADEIEVLSLSARPGEQRTVRWVGWADGRYDLEHTETEALDAPGSLVRLRARRDLEHWLEPDTVTALAQDFGSLLPVDVSVDVPVDEDALGVDAGRTVRRRVSEAELPWRAGHESPEARRTALAAYCRATLGFDPLDMIDLDLGAAGLSGVAFVLPDAVAPTAHGAHRVYLKRMLLGARVEDILPPWAFFARCVLDTSVLRPTASREALYEDELLLATREALGSAVRSWMASTLTSGSTVARRFVATHHLAVRSLALHDEEMADLAASVLPFETTDGPMTLEEFTRRHDRPRYTETVEEFRRSAAVARAQRLPLVNGGYVYDTELLARLAARRPAWRLTPLAPGDLEQVMTMPTSDDEARYRRAMTQVNTDLARWDCEAVLRIFEPVDLPAMLLRDREAEHQRAVAETVAERQDLWGSVLDTFATEASATRRIVFNAANTTVRQVLEAEAATRSAAVASLYVTALLLSGQMLHGEQTEILNESLATLVAGAVRDRPTGTDAAGEEHR